MSRFAIKPFLPRSLFGRATLILIIPILALQLVVAVVFIQRHFEDVTQQMTRSIAREIAVAMQIIETSPTRDIAQLRLSNLSSPLGFPLILEARDDPKPGTKRVFYDLSGAAMSKELVSLLGPRIAIDLKTNSKIAFVEMPTELGVLQADIPRARVSTTNPHQLLVLMISTALLLMIIAILFLRNQVKPILKLANAAEAFGKGRSESYRPEGAEEVRRAGSAFLSMRARLERQIEQRTRMLSGVSHDLRTPLTRMKLTLALMDDPETADMVRDVNDMEQMLEGFLAFARGDTLEDMEAVDCVQLAHDVLANARRSGAKINLSTQIETPGRTEMQAKRMAITRALENLITNAMRYGTRQRLSVHMLEKTCEFVVEDNGPGIPQDAREEMLRPFARLDTARNQDEGGGVGLGLSIAMDVARSHGGTLELSDSADLGGLKACLRLPR